MLSLEVMDQDCNGRVEQRTNMFVLAMVCSPDASAQVKIRNMSPGGALIEGPMLPAVGEQLCLSRGASSIKGQIAWCRDGKAGVRFDGRVAVGDWTPGGNSAQRRVDRVVQQAKTGSVLKEADERFLGQELGSSDLERLARSLDALADSLSENPAVIARFGTGLQTLDVASQVLRKLSRRTK